MNTLQADYAPYQKKYAMLPSYEQLNQEFEFLAITPLQQIDFPLRFLRRRMSDRIVGVCNFLQTLLQPNPGSYILMKESSFFSGEEKQRVQKLLHDLMAFLSRSTSLDTVGDEKGDAIFIHDLFKFWMHIKAHYRQFLEAIEQGWKKKPEQKQAQNHYFG